MELDGQSGCSDSPHGGDRSSDRATRQSLGRREVTGTHRTADVSRNCRQL